MEITESLLKEWKWSIAGFVLGFIAISGWMTHQETVAVHRAEVANRAPASVTVATGVTGPVQVSPEGLSSVGVK